MERFSYDIHNNQGITEKIKKHGIILLLAFPLNNAGIFDVKDVWQYVKNNSSKEYCMLFFPYFLFKVQIISIF